MVAEWRVSATEQAITARLEGVLRNGGPERPGSPTVAEMDGMVEFATRRALVRVDMPAGWLQRLLPVGATAERDVLHMLCEGASMSGVRSNEARWWMDGNRSHTSGRTAATTLHCDACGETELRSPTLGARGCGGGRAGRHVQISDPRSRRVRSRGPALFGLVRFSGNGSQVEQRWTCKCRPEPLGSQSSDRTARSRAR